MLGRTALLGLAAALNLLAQATRRETWPDGTLRAEYTLGFDARGQEVKHGPYRSFHPDGTLASEGAFELGRETGPWVRYHANGQRAAAGSYADGLQSGPWETFFATGSPESKGAYLRGARDGRWTFWHAGGAKDLEASGLHRLEVWRSREGDRVYRGYVVDNRREGAWTSSWADGSVQLEGRFRAGERTGPWTFRCPDGVPSALVLSGEYVHGAWAGPLALPEPPAFDPARWPAIEPAPEGWPAERAGLASGLAAALASGVLHPELDEALRRAGRSAIPLVLELWRTLDAEDASGRSSLGFLEQRVLRPLCAGHALSRHGESGPPDAAAARELQRAWLGLWAATHADREFWEVVVPGPSALAGGLRDPLQDPPLLERDPRYEPAARPAAAPSGPDLARVRPDFRLRFGAAKEEALRHAPAGTKECVERALRWLALHQGVDGSWSNAGFAARCGRIGREPCSGPGKDVYDVGATALSLLALLGDGNTHEQGPWSEAVRLGLAWLAAQQTPDGEIGARRSSDFLYGHALATAALCEGFALGADSLRVPAERALAFLQLGRHPDGGWRYDVPATEPGDTSVTGWAVHALLAGRRAGLDVDPAALEGAARWIERMTEPRTGRVGYNTRGELSARSSENRDFPGDLGEAMTAVGLWIRLALGQRAASQPILAEHARLVAAKPPRIDRRFGGDQYYWYQGTSALHEYGAPFWDRWEAELRKAVILTQVRRGDADGSWDPIGPWAYATGRVCSTALLALTLECFQRYPRAREVGR
jgi:antitoxin component YwqK of YwqJK toxin-antitoxin module